MCSLTVSVGRDAKKVTGDKTSKFRYSDKTCCKVYVRLFLCVFPGGRDAEHGTGGQDQQVPLLGQNLLRKSYVIQELCQSVSVCSSRWKRC